MTNCTIATAPLTATASSTSKPPGRRPVTTRMIDQDRDPGRGGDQGPEQHDVGERHRLGHRRATMGRVSGTTGYRRRIELVTVSPEVVQGELEDDFHHFRVSIAHDGAKVTAVEGTAVRHPWSTCPDALTPLRSLVGAPAHRGRHRPRRPRRRPDELHPLVRPHRLRHRPGRLGPRPPPLRHDGPRPGRGRSDHGPPVPGRRGPPRLGGRHPDDPRPRALHRPGHGPGLPGLGQRPVRPRDGRGGHRPAPGVPDQPGPPHGPRRLRHRRRGRPRHGEHLPHLLHRRHGDRGPDERAAAGGDCSLWLR